MNTRRQLLSMIAGLAGLPFIGGLLRGLEIRRLIAGLTHADRLVRSATVSQVLDMTATPKKLLPPLEKLLADTSEPFLAITAAGAISRAGPDEAARMLPVLVAALEHNDCMVQIAASESLGDLGHQAQAAVPALRNLLHDDCEAVRCDASVAIGRITGDWADAVAVGRSLMQDPDWMVRVVGEEHLGRVEGQQVWVEG